MELKDKAIIICEGCKKVIGMNYNNSDYDLQHDCFCIKCHNDGCKLSKK